MCFLQELEMCIRDRGHDGPKSKSGKFQEDSRKSRPSDRMRQEDEASRPQDTGKAQEPEGSAETVSYTYLDVYKRQG